jgi:hypothetical protein
MVPNVLTALLRLWLEASVLDDVSAGAREAQTRCYPRVHEDVFEFVTCVDEKVTDAESRHAEARALGLTYFGWVGCTSAARLSMPGAEVAAARYRKAFRLLQRKLKVTDAQLCATVEGDCAMRALLLREAETTDAGTPSVK